MKALTLNINPVPASRPRVARWGVYYGKKYTEFREIMKVLVLDIKTKPLKGLLQVYVSFHIPMPKSWNNKKKASRISSFCDNNYDIDNLQKAILDTLNGTLYEDDRQIVSITACKKWDRVGSIYLTITELY